MSVKARQAYERRFFYALEQTPECQVEATPPGLLRPAIDSAYFVPCLHDTGFLALMCEGQLYACFVDPLCRQCWGAVIGRTGGAYNVLNSSACEAVWDSEAFQSISCAAFPACSNAKLLCHSPQVSGVSTCSGCLTALQRGDAAAAVEQCPLGTVAQNLLDSAVVSCTASSQLGCEYWNRRCGEIPACSRCLHSLTHGSDAYTTARELGGPACRAAVADGIAAEYLEAYARVCPSVTPCTAAVVEFWSSAPSLAVACLAGTATERSSAECANAAEQIGLKGTCATCPASVSTINAVVIATAVIGAFSAPVCVWVVLTILAHGRHQASRRDRIVIGLMLTNALYSIANGLPLNLLRSDDVNCGQLALPFQTIRYGRAVWFGGKYGLVAFELLIVGASLFALRLKASGTLHRRIEMALYLGCFAVALVAFAAFAWRCGDVMAEGYNRSTEAEEFSNAFDHLPNSNDVEGDDDSPSIAATARFDTGRNDYDNLVRTMLIAWDVLAGFTVLLWVGARLLYRSTKKALRRHLAATIDAETEDPWAATRRSAWKTQRQLLEGRKRAFADIAIPLEPYIAVFVLFLIPAVVMSTPTCEAHSGAEFTGAQVGRGRTSTTTFGLCNVGCELALAFRSICTVLVYLWSPRRRREFVDLGLTVARLKVMARRRIKRWMGQREADREGPFGNFAALTHDDVEMDDMGWVVVDPSKDLAERRPVAETGTEPVPLASNVASWDLKVRDFKMRRVLGTGAFGEVWEATSLPTNTPVAVKVLTTVGRIWPTA